jgi:hypothetical protein
MRKRKYFLPTVKETVALRVFLGLLRERVKTAPNVPKTVPK